MERTPLFSDHQNQEENTIFREVPSNSCETAHAL